MLESLSELLKQEAPLKLGTLEQLLQGPLADAMTHAGQLAMLRRLADDPIPPENFAEADVRIDRLGTDQSRPQKPGNRHGQWPEKPA